MSLEPGKQISDSLRLVRLLGRGAMGSVWLADHLSLQSQVAVKFMAPAMADDPVSVQRFRQEARAAAEIRSPHVVQVFDHGETPDRQLYIVMELLEGESLDKRIRRAGVLRVDETTSLVVQCCKALAMAHKRGIIHRDIKPPNVFLVNEGMGDGAGQFVKLLDFGVAKFSGEEAMQMTAVGNMVGTPAYMSPEQLFHGREVDHRGDLWSVAVVAYFALTGERPFEGSTLGELCIAIKGGRFRPVSSFRHDIPPDLDAWFVRAFHPDVDQRFPSAKIMAQEVERATGLPSVMQSTPSGVATSFQLQTFGGASLSQSPPSLRPREPRRWPIAVGVGISLTLLIGAAAVLLGTGGMAAFDDPGAGDATTVAAQPAALDQADDEAKSDVVVADGDDGATLDLDAPLDDPPDGDAAEDNGDDAADDDATEATGVAAKPGPRPSYPGPKKPKPDPEPAEGKADDRSERAAEELGL